MKSRILNGLTTAAVLIIIGIFPMNIAMPILLAACAGMIGFVLYRSRRGHRASATVIAVNGLRAKVTYNADGRTAEAELPLTKKAAASVKIGSVEEIIWYPDAPGMVGREKYLFLLQYIMYICIALIPVFMCIKVN